MSEAAKRRHGPGDFGLSRLLGPALALVERMDRWRRRIRAIRPDGILGLELARHRGAALLLADGTRVEPGARIGIVHFDNARVRGIARRGWQGSGLASGRADLAALAAWAAALPPAERPVAYAGRTLMAPLAVRTGWEDHGPARSRFGWLENWYLRTLLARWSPRGRARLREGRPRGAHDLWLSAGALASRYGRGTGQ